MAASSSRELVYIGAPPGSCYWWHRGSQLLTVDTVKAFVCSFFAFFSHIVLLLFFFFYLIVFFPFFFTRIIIMINIFYFFIFYTFFFFLIHICVFFVAFCFFCLHYFKTCQSEHWDAFEHLSVVSSRQTEH